jgi:hypothetical protein
MAKKDIALKSEEAYTPKAGYEAYMTQKEYLSKQSM